MLKDPKVLFYLFLSDLIVTLFALIVNDEFMSFIGHLTLMNILALWYITKCENGFELKNFLIVSGLVLSSISDSIYYFEWSKAFLEFFQIFLSCFVNLIFIIVMRIEGVRIYTNSIYDLPKILIPLILIFLFFGFVIMPDVPNFVLLISVMFSVLEILIFTHSCFRIANKKSYYLVLLGVSLLVIKDAIYGLHFFYFQERLPILYVFQFPLNVLAYFFIVYGLAANIAFEPFGVTNTSNKRLSKFINEILDLKFSDILKLKAPYQ